MSHFEKLCFFLYFFMVAGYFAECSAACYQELRKRAPGQAQINCRCTLWVLCTSQSISVLWHGTLLAVSGCLIPRVLPGIHCPSLAASFQRCSWLMAALESHFSARFASPSCCCSFWGGDGKVSGYGQGVGAPSAALSAVVVNKVMASCTFGTRRLGACRPHWWAGCSATSTLAEQPGDKPSKN